MENLLFFFENVPEPFWVIDESYKLIYGNKAFFSLTQQVYQRKVNKLDSIFLLTDKDEESYSFWKHCYDKAFSYGSFSADRISMVDNNEVLITYELKVIKSLVKFLCIKGLIVKDPEKEFANELQKKEPAYKNELSLCINEQGELTYVSPVLVDILGYNLNGLTGHEKLIIKDFLHPEENGLLKSYFFHSTYIENVWCRVRDVNGKYFWCNVTMVAHGEKNINRIFNVTIKDLKIPKAPATADYLVPDADILQVIAQAQWLYITTGSIKQPFETCLQYFRAEGIAAFSFVASLSWKGTLPTLQIVAESGIWSYAEDNSISSLLHQLSSFCLEIQQSINDSTNQDLNIGYPLLFNNTDFTVHLLIQNSELMGVLVSTDYVFTNKRSDFKPKHTPIITYFKPVFSYLLNSNKFTVNTQDALNNLARNKDELQSLVASLDDIILEVNTDFIVVNIWCNDEALLPFPKEYIKGKNVKDIKGEILGVGVEDVILKVLDTGLTHAIEYTLESSDKVEWFEAKMNLVKMYTGEKRVSILIHNITPKKEAETAIAEALNKEKELNDMKSKMITGVSHEFRTPLATIVSSTELLEMHIKRNYDSINARTAELFTTIYDEAERLSEMMRSFLIMGRFEENQTPYRPKPTEIDKAVHRIIRNNFHLKYGDEKVRITTINEPRDAEVDPNLFWHIISNIVSNAVKYSPEEETVFIEILFENQHFTITVRDKGIGIPEKDLPNIFQSFYRAGNSDEHVGYGLGLAIVERFIKMHNASINVHSTVGEGSVFILTFNY